jgi:hypothetical protein
MSNETRVVAPGPSEGTVRDEKGKTLTIPRGWALLEPGDAGLTRKVKAAGPSWTVKAKKGRYLTSHGVWAPAEHIDAARAQVDATRATPAYAKQLASGRARREKAQVVYVDSFTRAVASFLAFAPDHADLMHTMAEAIAKHATPVGSGTVARTSRIPVEKRAEAATIAWMRHQTTGYDHMTIGRGKGDRREVRRALAQRSRDLLARYRDGDPIPAKCPLARALKHAAAATPDDAPAATRPRPRAKVRPEAALKGATGAASQQDDRAARQAAIRARRAGGKTKRSQA